jgi:predicted NBD/HSP70 family sugar kinase
MQQSSRLVKIINQLAGGVIMKRTKNIYQARIMREIWIRHKTSRIEISRSLGLDKATISYAINELINTGMIVEIEEGQSGPHGGRKPMYITLNKHYGCVIGVEVRPESCIAVAVDLEGEISFSRIERIPSKDYDLTALLISILQGFVDEVKASGQNLLGIGVGVSGVVNGDAGVIKYSAPLGITSDYHFYREIGSQFSVPVFIDNDANACIWGELAFHRRKELQDFIFLLLEFRDIEMRKDLDGNRISFGIGLAINGNVHKGYQYSAGEFRSIFRKPDSIGQFSLTKEEQKVLLEDEAVKEKFIRELGSNVGLLVNTFNLSHIILGGVFEDLGDRVVDIFEEEVKKNWPYPYPYTVKDNIWYSAFGQQAVAYGAAGMVLNNLFTNIEVLKDPSSK